MKGSMSTDLGTITVSSDVIAKYAGLVCYVYPSDLFIDRLIYLIIPGTVLLTLPLHVLRGFV